MTAELKVDPKKMEMMGGGAPLTQKRESLFADAMRRLVRNKAAVLGGSIIIILIPVGTLCGSGCFKTFCRTGAD